MTDSYVPDAGDLIWLNFDPQSGREQAGRRPALVLSAISYNRAAGLVVVCPVTSRRKGYPFEVPLPEGGGVTGVVLADHLKSADWRERQAKQIGHAPQGVLAGVRKHVGALLGL